MNLPAQFAILAGDKRQDAEGRTSLEAHEILNAAGRAGRAGHLANGIVLLISDPVTGFTANGKPDNRSVAKLRKLLPPNDQCVPMDDPLTALLDQIQAGRIDDAAVRYFTSRVQAGEEPTEAAEQAVAMVNRSFAAFKARQAQQNEVFEQKLDALRAVLAKSDSTPAIATIAASTGLSNEPLLAVYSRLAATPTSMPQSVAAWVDWLIAFFASDQASYLSLLGDDADVVRYAVRGKKTGGHPTAAEFSLLNNGLKAWISGKTFHEIELALGVEAKKVKRCPRARDLVLKLANRSFYLIASSVVEVAKVVLAEHHLSSTQPAVLETLAVAIRKGIDTPDKIAFGYRRPALRSRVLVHRDFAAVLGAPMNTTGLDYETVLAHTTACLAFATLS
jgi:ATP-dependent RNA helicase HelY